MDISSGCGQSCNPKKTVTDMYTGNNLRQIINVTSRQTN